MSPRKRVVPDPPSSQVKSACDADAEKSESEGVKLKRMISWFLSSARLSNRRRRKHLLSIPVAFDRNSYLTHSALWWRDALAISSALDMGDLSNAAAATAAVVAGDDDDDRDRDRDDRDEKGKRTTAEAGMSDLLHAAEAAMTLARAVSGTLLEDLRALTRSLEFWEELRDDRDKGSLRFFLMFRLGPSAFVKEAAFVWKRFTLLAKRRARRAVLRVSASARVESSDEVLETILPRPSASAIVDGKVEALGKLQRSLASAVAKVHARADDLVNNGAYNGRRRRTNSSGDGRDDEEEEEDGLSEEERRMKEVIKTREAVEKCVNGINEAIEMVKTTTMINAEYCDDDDEHDYSSSSLEKQRHHSSSSLLEKKSFNNNEEGAEQNENEVTTPKRPSSSLERTISNSPLFAGMMSHHASSSHNRSSSYVPPQSMISRSGTPKSATAIFERQNATLQRSNSYFHSLTTFLGDIFSSDAGTGGQKVGFVSHKLRTRLINGSGEPISFPLENDTTWQVIVSTESRFAKVKKAVGRTVERHRKPTKYERRWIPAALLSIIGVSTAIVLVRKSSLCGSTELEEALINAFETTRTFFNSYMKTPSLELKQELTKAFDTGDRADAAARLGESQESLERMLKEYVKNATKPGFSESLSRAYQSVGALVTKGDSENESDSNNVGKVDPMSLVTARVEEELKAPLQNILGGDLMQLLLIQTQVMKVEMEDALLQMDAVMRANRLNFALMACFPATLFVYGTWEFSKTLGAARVFQKRRKAREEMRLLVADAERSLVRLKMTRDEFMRSKKHGNIKNNDDDAKDVSDSENLISRLEKSERDRRDRNHNASPYVDENLENETFHQGMVLYAVNALYASCQKHKNLFTLNEYRGVKLDVMALADVSVSIEGKMTTTNRLQRAYKCLQAEPHRVPSIVTGRYPI